MFKDRLLLGVVYLFKPIFNVIATVLWIFFDVNLTIGYESFLLKLQQQYNENYERIRKN